MIRIRSKDAFPVAATAVAALVAMSVLAISAPGLARNLTWACVVSIPFVYALTYYRLLRSGGSNTERAAQAALHALKLGFLLLLPLGWGLFSGPYGGLLGQVTIGLPKYFFFGGRFAVFQLVLIKAIVLPVLLVAADLSVKRAQSRL